MKLAIIVVDMLNDFIVGKLGSPKALAVVEPNKKLITKARQEHIPIIYVNDSHYKGVDQELALWGDHALKGTKGAKVVSQIKPTSKDYVIKKRRYSGFFGTDLNLLLKELKIDTLVITGLLTHLCVWHTVADAYQWGYKIIVPKDATNSINKEDYESSIRYFKQNYGATITNVGELVKEF